MNSVLFYKGDTQNESSQETSNELSNNAPFLSADLGSKDGAGSSSDDANSDDSDNCDDSDDSDDSDSDDSDSDDSDSDENSPPAKKSKVDYGIGAKLMAKMGFKEGAGLGKNGEGITEPITQTMRPRQLGLGAVSERPKDVAVEKRADANEKTLKAATLELERLIAQAAQLDLKRVHEFERVKKLAGSSDVIVIKEASAVISSLISVLAKKQAFEHGKQKQLDSQKRLEQLMNSVKQVMGLDVASKSSLTMLTQFKEANDDQRFSRFIEYKFCSILTTAYSDWNPFHTGNTELKESAATQIQLCIEGLGLMDSDQVEQAIESLIERNSSNWDPQHDLLEFALFATEWDRYGNLRAFADKFVGERILKYILAGNFEACSHLVAQVIGSLGPQNCKTVVACVVLGLTITPRDWGKLSIVLSYLRTESVTLNPWRKDVIEKLKSEIWPFLRNDPITAASVVFAFRGVIDDSSIGNFYRTDFVPAYYKSVIERFGSKSESDLADFENEYEHLKEMISKFAESRPAIAQVSRYFELGRDAELLAAHLKTSTTSKSKDSFRDGEIVSFKRHVNDYFSSKGFLVVETNSVYENQSIFILQGEKEQRRCYVDSDVLFIEVDGSFTPVSLDEAEKSIQ